MQSCYGMSKQHGLTLVELMISLVLGAILMSSVISVIIAGQNSYNDGQRFTALQGDFAYINDMILVDVRRATAVSTANNGSELTLTLPNAAGTVVVVYSRNSDGELTRQVGVNAAELVAENINVFTTTCLTASSVVIADCTNAVQLATTVEINSRRGNVELPNRVTFRSTLRNAVLNTKFKPATGA